MRTFRDVIRELLERLRQSPSARFLPPAAVEPERRLYRTEATSWGRDGGYDPEHMPLPSGFETRVMPPLQERRPALQVFRIFDE